MVWSFTLVGPRLLSILVPFLFVAGTHCLQTSSVVTGIRDPFRRHILQHPHHSTSTRPATLLYQQQQPASNTSPKVNELPKHQHFSSSNSNNNKVRMRLLSGIRDIVDDYDVFLLDMWGVMHDGTRPYEGVLDVVQQLRQRSKTMIVLSNSSKRTDHSLHMLKKLGFDPTPGHGDFYSVITSGEVAFQMLQGNSHNAKQPSSRKMFVLGSGDGDCEYCESSGWSLAPVDEADLIVARGTFTINGGGDYVIDKREDEQRYNVALNECLARAADRRLPMLVCNPDKVRPDAERPPMPGKIGDAYETALGGDSQAKSLVKRVGKPFADVYELALQAAASVMDDTEDMSRICMVGDALETDIAGGAKAGISTLWVLKDGIHSPDLVGSESLRAGAESILEEFNQMKGTYAAGELLSPDMILDHFRW